jgi:hypothetical protein
VNVRKLFFGTKKATNGNNNELSEGFKGALRLFVYYYTNGTLAYLVKDGSLLGSLDYREALKDEPSIVEQVFAIYTNNIRMDANGQVLNQSHAMNRAAQYIIHSLCDSEPRYQAVPDFEDWELELH